MFLRETKMESQNKTVHDDGGMETTKMDVMMMMRSEKKVIWWELGLRLVSCFLTLGAAIVLSLDKQSTVVAFQFPPGLPAFNVAVTAKWTYLSAFVYAVVCNYIASAYAAISAILSVKHRRLGRGILEMGVVVVDVMMIGLLFSANGAAGAVGVIGYKGNSHVKWNKVCYLVGRFCNQVAASMSLSLLGALGFVFLVLLSALSLHKKGN